MEFCCDVCSLQGSFTQIIEHFINHHSDQNLVISRRVFSHVSGKIARQSLDYALILRDIMQQGDEIQIDADNIKVRVGYPKKITRVKKNQCRKLENKIPNLIKIIVCFCVYSGCHAYQEL